jgi:aldose sugar dehydrogenase
VRGQTDILSIDACVLTFVFLAFTVSIPSVIASAGPGVYIEDPNLEVEEVADGLESPTSMAFLDEDRILVLEKDGKVKEVRDNKVLGVPVLDITSKVDDRVERGMLGIDISTNKQNDNKEDGEEANTSRYIFLFYTEKILDSNDNECTSNDCRTNSFVTNRLYRYQLEDNKLVDPKLILEIPGSKSNSTFIHLGGTLVTGPDNYLYLTTGDGEGCHDYQTCFDTIHEGPLGAETANMQSGARPSGMGGILRIPISGDEPMNSEGILGDEYPLNLYYAYGIRNSFGMDFDPVTGKLWDTENGPTFGDEINLVEPGFNSGWAKIQGVWPISNYSQLTPSLLTQRGFFVDDTNSESEYDLVSDNLIDFDGKGKYSGPEFTWNETVGVTAMEFISSDHLGEKYENDILVGTFNEGVVYHFDLDDERKEILLDGSLDDKVANNSEELEKVVFARGFGAISDIEVGQDGHLYILSISKGKVYKILSED